jgi:hypothetical protein
VKSANESITSNTTIQSDNQLVTVLQAGGTYWVRASLIVSGDVAGDFKMAWDPYVGTGVLTSATRACIGPTPGTTNVANGSMRCQTGLGLNTEVSYGTVTGSYSYIEEDLYVTAAITTSLRIQWAQSTSSATATTIYAGSRIQVVRIS